MKTTDEMLTMVRADFAGLFRVKDRQGSIEIDTAFTTPWSEFVQVFYTTREGEHVITDDGAAVDIICDAGYTVAQAEAVAADVATQFRDLKFHDGRYYKRNPAEGLITSMIFDVASFVQRAAIVADATLEMPTP